jgi:hypothetical protein
MEDIISWQQHGYAHGADWYFGCKLKIALGNYDVGHVFSDVWNYYGEVNFYEKLDGDISMSITHDRDRIIPDAKRRKLNPPGENVYLTRSGKIIAEIDVIRRLQFNFLERYLAPAAMGGRSFIEQKTPVFESARAKATCF